jgi:hypothetical protein
MVRDTIFGGNRERRPDSGLTRADNTETANMSSIYRRGNLELSLGKQQNNIALYGRSHEGRRNWINNSIPQAWEILMAHYAQQVGFTPAILVKSMNWMKVTKNTDVKKSVDISW